jgi:hypothetical protein
MTNSELSKTSLNLHGETCPVCCSGMLVIRRDANVSEDNYQSSWPNFQCTACNEWMDAERFRYETERLNSYVPSDFVVPALARGLAGVSRGSRGGLAGVSRGSDLGTSLFAWVRSKAFCLVVQRRVRRP